ncbi:MAG TPA: hypothetical protein VEV42_16160 [Pyrinomonadaceae bacterium]|jgi:hypothetical protein|nr:hypothetical protein [Pyrinomonadaceae bacterium]
MANQTVSDLAKSLALGALNGAIYSAIQFIVVLKRFSSSTMVIDRFTIHPAQQWSRWWELKQIHLFGTNRAVE